MIRLDGAELTSLLELPHGADVFGDEVVVVVDGPPPAVDLSGLPVVVVGVDVVADDVDRIVDAVVAHPDAAIALVVLLRAGDTRTIAEGLVAESATYALLQASSDHRRWLDDRRPRRSAVERAGDDRPPVSVRRDGETLRVTLDRPHVRNAYDTAMQAALVDVLAEAALDPTLRVVINGAGPSFCSGGDLAQFGQVADPATAHRLRLRRSAGLALAAVAERVAVEVHGACVGAGVELPAFAGRVVAAADTTFRLPEVAMGLVPGAGGTVSLPRRIGRQRTALLALTGEPVDAATALEWGLVDVVRPSP